jgi:hypothetical protein
VRFFPGWVLRTRRRRGACRGDEHTDEGYSRVRLTPGKALAFRIPRRSNAARDRECGEPGLHGKPRRTL